MLPAIALSYTTRIPRDTFAEFERVVAAKGLDLHVEQRDEDGPFAGLEWLIPTAVVLFIGKAYFDGFLKEMGKDYYALLKAGLKSLYSRLLGPHAPKAVAVSAGGKTSNDQPYSLLYSIFAEANEGARFKLLLQCSASEEEYEATVEAFLAFLEAYHNGTLAVDVVTELQSTKVVGRTVLLAYKPSLKRVQPVDPLPARRTGGA
jgi:hypothetical protein